MEKISLEKRKQWCLDNIVGQYGPNNFKVEIEGDKIVVYGNIIIYDTFKELPDEALIDVVHGDVLLSNSIEYRKGMLKSLKNMPRIIFGHFICSNNPNLTSLEGGPEQVQGNYIANHCSLKNLKGCPKVVGVMKVYSNKLESIDDITLSEFHAIDIDFNTTLDKSTPLIQKLYKSDKIIV